MNLLQLVTMLRRHVLDDTGGTGMDWTDPVVEPLLRWSNEDCTTYLNEAQKEAAKRSRMFLDASYSLKLKEGKSVYFRDPKILQVRSATLKSGTNGVAENQSVLDIQEEGGWETRTGSPVALCADYKPGAFYVWPQPVAEDTMNLVVWRYPRGDLDWDRNTAEIEFTDEYAYPLVYGAASYAYLKEEANTIDLERSQFFEAKFSEEFGTKESTRSELMKGRRYPRDASYGGLPIRGSGSGASGRRNRYGSRNGSRGGGYW